MPMQPDPNRALPKAYTKRDLFCFWNGYEHAFLAAQRRLERSEVNRGHDRRQIGTSEERQRLAQFAKELGSDRIAQYRDISASVLVETLELRAKHFEATSVKFCRKKGVIPRSW